MATSDHPERAGPSGALRRPNAIDLQASQPPGARLASLLEDAGDRTRARRSHRPARPAAPSPARRWVEGRVLACRKIGGIRDERVERPRPERGAEITLRPGKPGPASVAILPASVRRRQKCRSPRLPEKPPSSARLRAIHPLPVPMSTTRPFLTTAQKDSTSPSVSGAGYQRAPVAAEHEVAETRLSDHMAQWLTGGAPRITAS